LIFGKSENQPLFLSAFNFLFSASNFQTFFIS
jgi:hypothetical protein